MAGVDDILGQMRNSPKTVRYRQLCKVCDYYFGTPRQPGGSHRIYRMPWRGDPRVNIQNDKGFAKTYQVRQVLKAIERLQNEEERKH
jgi:hypothetical protein